MKTILPLLVLAALAAGCAKTQLKLGDAKLQTSTFGNNRKFGALEYRKSKDGAVVLRIEGYESDQVQALKAGLEAGLEAAKATAPTP